MERTKTGPIIPPKAHSPVIHGVFYIPAENQYVVIPSSSTLFPKDFDERTVRPWEKYEMKDRLETFEALYIFHSTSKTEVDRKQAQLQDYIDIWKSQDYFDSGKHIDSHSSLFFLKSLNETEDDCEIESHVSNLPDISVAALEKSVEASHCEISAKEDVSLADSLQELKQEIAKSNRYLHLISKDVERNRKLTSKLINRLSDVFKNQSQSLNNEEIAQENLWMKAVKTRFSIDDEESEEVQSAVIAVN